MTPDEFTAALAQTPATPLPPAAPAPELQIDPTTGAPMMTDPVAAQGRAFDAAVAKAQTAAALAGADTSTGAPAEVRLGVGASSDPDTRLARLREYYPDAAPVPGTGNFVYTDPASGKRQTYAPIGLRVPNWGDIASLAPEAAETAGAVLGGIGGTFVGGPGVGTAVGGGTGALAAKELTERGIAKFLGMPDLRTPQQQIADAGITGTLNAVLPGATDAAGRAIARGLLAPGAGTATQQAARALDDAGVTQGLADMLPAGVAAENRGVQRGESALMQTIGGGGVANRYADTGAALREGVQTLAGSNVVAPATVPTADTFGSTVQGIANDVNAHSMAYGSGLKDQLNLQLGSSPVYFDNLRSTLNVLKARRAVSPQSMAQTYDDAIAYGDKIMQDAQGQGGSLPFANALQQRTLANAQPDWLTLGGADAILDSPMKQVAGAVRNDLYDTATNASSPTNARPLQALRDYDSYWRDWMTGPNATIGNLASDKTSSKTIQQMMMASTPKAQMDMANLWSLATPEQKGVLQGGVLQTLGDTGQGFDMGQFNKNWRLLGQQQKDLVFGSGPGSLGESLDNLATVQNAIRDQAATRGHSNTGAVWAALSLLGGIGHGIVTGDPLAAAGTAAAGFGTPMAAARLLQSRPFVNAITGAWGVAPDTAGWWGRQVGRVAAAGEADPAISGLVNDYIKQLPPEPTIGADGQVQPRPAP